MGDKTYKVEDWKEWDNVACRIPIKEMLESKAQAVGRSTTNYLEQILCEHLKVKVPVEVGKRK